jgi:hypothetical protein
MVKEKPQVSRDHVMMELVREQVREVRHINLFVMCQYHRFRASDDRLIYGHI